MEHEDKREQWKKDLETWRSSGKTITAWCKENNISYHTFQNRRKRLGDNRKNPRAVKFLELTEQSRAESGIRLEVNTISLHLSEQLDETTLLRCLRALRSL